MLFGFKVKRDKTTAVLLLSKETTLFYSMWTNENKAYSCQKLIQVVLVVQPSRVANVCLRFHLLPAAWTRQLSLPGGKGETMSVGTASGLQKAHLL